MVLALSISETTPNAGTTNRRVIAVVSSSNYFHEEDMEIQD
jgi:hypothetical protein